MLILIDRDGVLNVDRRDYVKSPDELVMLPGSAAAVACLNRAGHKVAVCTNQACVGRGIVDMAMIDLIHHRLRQELAHDGAHVDEIFIAPDKPRADGSWLPTDRRKPGSGMVLEALDRFGASADQAIFIGDTLTDMQAAAGAGVARYMVMTGHGRDSLAKGFTPAIEPIIVCDDLAAAVEHFLNKAKS